MRKKNIVWLMAVVSLVCVISTATAYMLLQESFRFSGAESIQKVRMSIIVGDVVGLNTDTDMLNFGIVVPGSGVSREINITNTKPYDIEVRLYKEGNISGLVSFPDTTIVNSGISQSIRISAGVPPGTGGEYTGELIIAYFPLPS